jgi:hypothetical protein
MMNGKVVISGDRVFLKFLDLRYFDERAREAGAWVVPVTSSDDDVLRESIRDAVALILIDRPLRKDLIDAMQKCRVILALEVGYDFIDVVSATARGIMVCNVPAYCTDEVALHATALIVATNRKLTDLMAETAKGGWDYKVCQPLSLLTGKRLGIVGLGRIGTAVVPKARGLGLHVAAYDPYLPDDVFAQAGVHRHPTLEGLLADDRGSAARPDEERRGPHQHVQGEGGGREGPGQGHEREAHRRCRPRCSGERASRSRQPADEDAERGGHSARGLVFRGKPGEVEGAGHG